MNNIFQINYTLLVRLLLPTRLRTAVQVAWLIVLIKPIVTLRDKFLNARVLNLLYAGTTSQVVSLERLLNTLFDSSARRIYITDADERELAFAYNNNNVLALHVYNNNNADAAYVYNTDGLAWDFVVHIPPGVGINETDLRNILNRFKIPSKNYILKYIV